MIAIPHQETYSDDKDDKEYQPLDSTDESVVADKASKGELVKGEEDIDETLIEFDKDTFPALGGEKEGDKVVVVLSGEVEADTNDSVIVCFQKASIVHGKLPPLGSGKRFANLEHSLSAKGAHNPGALAAWIGRKKYGNAKFSKLSQGGKK